MTVTLFKEVNYSLLKLIEDIDNGEIGLPDIQRPFVWNNAKVRDLFDSMYSGFPVGYLLFWGNANTQGAKQIGVDGKQTSVPRLLIVDGQQRLTSLYAVLRGVPVINSDFEEATIRIAFRPRDASFAVADATIEKDPEYIPNISALWSGEKPRNRFVKDFLTRLRGSRDVSEDDADHLYESIDRLYDLHSYPFTALELSSTVDEEQVANVFVRINSKGVTLNQADFILTLMSVWWDEGRAELEKFSRESRKPSTSSASPFNHFIEPDPDQMLRVAVGLGFKRGQLRHVYSLLRGRDLDTGVHTDENREAQFEKLRDAQAYTLDLVNWHEFLNTLVRAGFRSSGMISSNLALLYAYAFFLIGKRDFKVERGRLRTLVARWFFATAMTGRYSSSPESTVEGDFALLRGLNTDDEFVATLEKVIDDTLTEDFWNIGLPNDLVSSAGRSPALYAYYAALNLLDARVLFSKLKVNDLFDPAIKGKRSALERHHLFPKAYLKKMGLESTKETNQIANFALLEWPDNAAISDAPPSEYFPPLVAELTEPERENANFWHALPPAWYEMSYNDFLQDRRKRIAKVVRAGFESLTNLEQTASSASIDELIAAGESDRVEFKSSARWNSHTGERDARLEQVIVKTVAAFANGEGGTLVIGVNDDGKVLGIDNDLSLMKKPDADRYQLWITDLLISATDKPTASSLKVTFPEVGGVQIVRVDVPASDRPVFVSSGSSTEKDFYLRVGNSTHKLNGEELLAYREKRWS